MNTYSVLCIFTDRKWELQAINALDAVKAVVYANSGRGYVRKEATTWENWSDGSPVVSIGDYVARLDGKEIL